LIYILYKKFNGVKSPYVDKIVDASALLVAIIFSYGFTGLVLGIPFKNYIPFDWQYAGLVTWAVFFLIYYSVATKSNLNKLTAFTLSSLSVVGGGWLYEIPFFHPVRMFIDYNNIFYLNGQILILLVLAYELRKIGFKMNRTIYTTLSLYLVFSGKLSMDWRGVARAFNAIYPGFYLWIYRVPTCLLLLSLLGGLRRKEDDGTYYDLFNVEE